MPMARILGTLDDADLSALSQQLQCVAHRGFGANMLELRLSMSLKSTSVVWNDTSASMLCYFDSGFSFASRHTQVDVSLFDVRDLPYTIADASLASIVTIQATLLPSASLESVSTVAVVEGTAVVVPVMMLDAYSNSGLFVCVIGMVGKEVEGVLSTDERKPNAATCVLELPGGYSPLIRQTVQLKVVHALSGANILEGVDRL